MVQSLLLSQEKPSRLRAGKAPPQPLSLWQRCRALSVRAPLCSHIPVQPATGATTYVVTTENPVCLSYCVQPLATCCAHAEPLYPEGPHQYVLSQLGSFGAGEPQRDQRSSKSQPSTFREGTDYPQHRTYSGMGTPAQLLLPSSPQPLPGDLYLTTVALSNITPYKQSAP